MPNPEFIKASADHVDHLVEFHLNFSEEFHGKQNDALIAQLRTDLKEFYTAELNKSYFSWYAVVDGTPAAVGGVCIRTQPGNVRNPSGKWGYLFGVYTEPKFRRQGLSKQIVERLMQSAKEMGITALELHATKAGEPLYIQSGFIQHNEPTYRHYF
jgi:GNAT superfamily N-acetyltransferase